MSSFLDATPAEEPAPTISMEAVTAVLNELDGGRQDQAEALVRGICVGTEDFGEGEAAASTQADPDSILAETMAFGKDPKDAVKVRPTASVEARFGPSKPFPIVTERFLRRALHFTIKMVRQAGAGVKRAFFEDIEKKQVDEKGATDFVTVFDKACENFLIKTIKEEFPGHSILAEESSGAGGYELTDVPTWVIDPIDGTTNFIRRVPECAVSVALVVEKRPVIGVVYNPISGDMYSAAEGMGAQKNGRQLVCSSDCDSISSALVYTNICNQRDQLTVSTYLEHQQRMITEGAIAMRMCGSAALSSVYVAEGIADVYYETGPHPWDVAAAAIICKEAGATLLDYSGEGLDLCSRTYIAAASDALAQKVADVLRAPLTRVE